MFRRQVQQRVPHADSGAPLHPGAGNDGPFRNWYYTTSPPISAQQTVNNTLTITNLTANCLPQIAVGPGGLMNTLESLTFPNGDPVTAGSRIPIIQNHGNVILVRKGNPRRIRSVWDLARVRLVTSNPDTEPGSFGNYSGSIFNIAAAQRGEAAATRLFNRIFNQNNQHLNGGDDDDDDGRWHGGDDDDDGNRRWHRRRGAWLAGARIHHREMPWSVAIGEADAGLMFYHLALFAIRINGSWNPTQFAAQEELIDGFLSPEITAILSQYGLVRPDGF